MPEQRLLTVREACDELRISRPTLGALRRSGRIQTTRIGSRGVRVASSEIERFIAAATGGDCDNLAPLPRRRGMPKNSNGSD